MSPGTAPGLRLTRVKQDNGSQAPQLRLIHLHVFHFGHQLCQNSACGGHGWADNQRQVQTARLEVEKHLGQALGIAQFLSAGRGSFEGQPCHTLLVYACISSIQGPEHQTRSRSHFAQHTASVLFGLRRAICPHLRKTTWVFLRISPCKKWALPLHMPGREQAWHGQCMCSCHMSKLGFKALPAKALADQY